MHTLLRLLLLAAPLYPMIGSAQTANSAVDLTPPALASVILPVATYTPKQNAGATLMSNPSRTAALRWAAVGAGIGAIVGLGAYAAVDAETPDFCDEREPGCTSKSNYSRRGFVVSFAAIGAVAGAALGARSAR